MSIPEDVSGKPGGIDDLEFGLQATKGPGQPKSKSRLLILSLLLVLCLGLYAPFAIDKMLDRHRRAQKEALERRGVSKCLPPGLKLDTPLDDGPLWQELAKLGAYSKEGKLYDSSGKEITFYTNVIGGTPAYRDDDYKARDMARDIRKREMDALKKRYRVIFLHTVVMP
jgi:hypothetical protein